MQIEISSRLIKYSLVLSASLAAGAYALAMRSGTKPSVDVSHVHRQPTRVERPGDKSQPAAIRPVTAVASPVRAPTRNPPRTVRPGIKRNRHGHNGRRIPKPKRLPPQA